MADQWQAGVPVEMLELRAGLLRRIRTFMEERSIMEVDTPVLSHAAVTDPNLQSLTTRYHPPDSKMARTLYLATSPEFAMKRLLASGSGPIYQISHVFRDGESGTLHNPEFTILEWYRPGFDEVAMMEEISALLALLNFNVAQKHDYGEVFQQATGIDPHNAAVIELQQAAGANGLHSGIDDRAGLLDFLFNRLVAETLGHDRPVFIHDYPACQCALARLNSGAPPVARRFELFIKGIEIANGFYELADAAELRRRFVQDNRRRRRNGLPEVPVDERLLHALDHGLPDCAGVAVGVDRLLMVMQGVDDIRKVLAFPVDHA